jgi:hypothetical protein
LLSEPIQARQIRRTLIAGRLVLTPDPAERTLDVPPSAACWLAPPINM